HHPDPGAVARSDPPTHHAPHARPGADPPFVGLACRPLCCSGSANSTNCFSLTRMMRPNAQLQPSLPQQKKWLSRGFAERVAHVLGKPSQGCFMVALTIVICLSG